MSNKRVLLASLVVAVLCVVSYGTWLAAGHVPQLQSPVRVVDESALADGGTIWVAVVDAKGTWLGFGTRGSLEAPRDKFPVILRRWEVLPLFRQFEPGDERILEIARVASQAATDSRRNSLAQQLASELHSRAR